MNKFGRDLTWVCVIKVGVISVGSLTVVWCMKSVGEIASEI